MESQKVAGLGDGAARDGHGAAHERQAEIDGVADGGAGRGVEHGAADVGGQAAGRHAAARDGLDELLFRALWVADVQRQQVDAAAQHGGNGGDGLGLVLLDADGGALSGCRICRTTRRPPTTRSGVSRIRRSSDVM